MKPMVAEEKVPGGKLVRVTVGPDGRVAVSGDFFMHPEESIALIEDALGRLTYDTPPAAMEKELEQIIARGNIQLIGVDVPAIIGLYRQCLSGKDRG
jgi:hypothetical protein